MSRPLDLRSQHLQRRGLMSATDDMSGDVWLKFRRAVVFTSVRFPKMLERELRLRYVSFKSMAFVFTEKQQVQEEWLVGGDPFYLKFWVNRPPLEQNRRF